MYRPKPNHSCFHFDLIFLQRRQGPPVTLFCLCSKAQILYKELIIKYKGDHLSDQND